MEVTQPLRIVLILSLPISMLGESNGSIVISMSEQCEPSLIVTTGKVLDRFCNEIACVAHASLMPYEKTIRDVDAANLLG